MSSDKKVSFHWGRRVFLSRGSFPAFGGCPAPPRSSRCCSPPIPLLHGGWFPGAPGHRSRLGQAHRGAAPTPRPAPQSRGLCFEGGGGQGHMDTEWGRFCKEEVIDLGGAGEAEHTGRGALPRCWGPVGGATAAGRVLKGPECQVPPGWGRARGQRGRQGCRLRPSLGVGLLIPATHPGPLRWGCKPTPPGPPAPPRPQTRGMAGFGSSSISSPQTSLRDLVPESRKFQSRLPLLQDPQPTGAPCPLGL